MLKYLIIQLDDTAVSFCHYSNNREQRRLIPLEILKEGILWSMKENLTIQFLYPDYDIPSEYKAEIAKTFHADIVSSTCADENLRKKADVVVFDSFDGIADYPFNKEQSYVFRSTIKGFIDNSWKLNHILPRLNRINIVLNDIPSFKKEDESKYAEALDLLAQKVADEYKVGHGIQINLLTDRILLDGMNNCNAGDDTIALCPDGKFYVCPAFYIDGEADGDEISQKDVCQRGYAIGSLKDGLDIKNPQLYKITHAPICRKCDAYQCRRCVWLNRRLTLEVNTPSREQCVIAHLERNTSRKLLNKIREIGQFMPDKVIEELNYLDPFENIQQ